jgi:hypothetical protein
VGTEADLAQLRVDLDALTEMVAVLAGRIVPPQPTAPAGEAPGDGGEGQPCRWAWRYATDEVAGGLWARLREFVDWLNRRYALDSERQIPSCWYRHPVAVEELTALLCSWQSVYCGPDNPGDSLLAWHAHSLWPCVDRLPARSGWQRCRGGQHIERSVNINPTDDHFDIYVGNKQSAPGDRPDRGDTFSGQERMWQQSLGDGVTTFPST